jgi:DNA-binding transcriptional LysR family regulator
MNHHRRQSILWTHNGPLLMRPLKLDQLKAFVEVAKHGGFTGAARAVNLTQPAITRQVHELEQRFQIALFERVGNRVHLTPAGQKLLEYGRPLLEQDARARAAMRDFVDGYFQHVRIGTSMTVLMYALPPLLRQLKADHPHLDIRLKTGLTSDTLRLLNQKDLDIGLCAFPVDELAFDAEPLLDDDLVAILPANAGHIPETITPDFLRRSPLIMGNKQSALRRSFTAWLAHTGQVPNPIMELDNVEAIKSVVAAGLGSSIVPSLSLTGPDVAHRNIAVRPINPCSTRQIGLVKPRGMQPTDAVSIVYDVLLNIRQHPKLTIGASLTRCSSGA